MRTSHVCGVLHVEGQPPSLYFKCPYKLLSFQHAVLQVLEAIRGLRTIFSGKGAKLVPLKERPAAISVNKQAKAAIERDSWVRVRGGLYKDDLAKVSEWGAAAVVVDGKALYRHHCGMACRSTLCMHVWVNVSSRCARGCLTGQARAVGQPVGVICCHWGSPCWQSYRDIQSSMLHGLPARH